MKILRNVLDCSEEAILIAVAALRMVLKEFSCDIAQEEASAAATHTTYSL